MRGGTKVATEMENATAALAAALRESEECQSYLALKDQVMSDDTNKALLKEYQRAQTSLQMAAMAGKEPDDEAVQKFSRLSGLLYMNPEISQYLLAQIRVQKLVGEVFQTLAKAAEMDMELPGM